MDVSDVFLYVNNKLHDKEKIIFEVGAYKGDSSYNIIQFLSPVKEYHAFEPDYRNFKILESQFLNFKFTKANFLAIGSFDGKTNFYHSGGVNSISNDWSASSSIKKPKLATTENPWLTFNEITEIKIITLDTYCNNNNISNIDFIWADVQGAEEDLILGGKNILKHTKFLFTEYCDFERYEGEINKNKILELLPDWQLVYDLGTDVFLVNTKI
jgi:FkbM family methyltransferase